MSPDPKMRCGSYAKLQEALDRVEDEFQVPTVPDEYGCDEKWLELLEQCSNSGGVLAHSDDEIVGYWQCFPVTDEVYSAVLRGKNVDKSISKEDIRELLFPQSYSLFFISLFLSKDDRKNLGTGRLMMRSFLDSCEKQRKKGFFSTKLWQTLQVLRRVRFA